MTSVLFSDYKNFKFKKQFFKNKGKEKLAVITDFDRTLSCRQYHSMMAVLSEEDIISKEYVRDMNELFDKYYHQERSTEKTIEEKEEIMQKWWEETYDVWKKHKLHKEHLHKVVHNSPFHLRNGVDTFFTTLQKYNVPSIILSASGLGIDGILLALEKYAIDIKNILNISNTIEWDMKNFLIGPKHPIIHSANKTIKAKEHADIPKHFHKRENILVIGDSLHDANMAKCLPTPCNTITIGILEENLETHLKLFKDAFDIVLHGDVDFQLMVELSEEICSK